MPQVPTYNSGVSESGIPNVRLSPSAPIEAFGGGSAQASALENSGRELSGLDQFVQKQKEMADDLRVQEAANSAKALEQNLTWDPQNGFTQKKGKDAFGIINDYGKSLNEGLDQISNNLANEEQQKKFALIRGQVTNSFDENMQKHVGIESKKYADDVYRSGIQLSQQDAVLNYSTPGKIQENIDQQKQLIQKYAATNGLPEEAVQSAIVSAASKTHEDVIKRMLDNNQDLLAQQYFKDNKSNLTADAIDQSEKLLKIGRSDGEAQRQVDQMQQDGLSYQDALDQAGEDNKDPVIRKAVEERVKSVYSAQQTAFQRDKEQTFLQASSIVENGGGKDPIPVSLRAQLTPEQNTALENRAKQLQSGELVPQNGATYQKYKLMAANPDTRNLFISTDVGAHSSEMTPKEFKELIELKANLISKDPSTADAATALLDYQDQNGKIVRDTMAKIGIDTSGGGFTLNPLKWFSGSTSPKEILDFQNNIDQAVKQKEQTLGRKILPDEMQEIANTFATKVVTSSGDRYIGRLDSANVQIGDVPSDVRNNISRTLQAKGWPVTEQNIIQFYVKGLKSGVIKSNAK